MRNRVYIHHGETQAEFISRVNRELNQKLGSIGIGLIIVCFAIGALAFVCGFVIGTLVK